VVGRQLQRGHWPYLWHDQTRRALLAGIGVSLLPPSCSASASSPPASADSGLVDHFQAMCSHQPLSPSNCLAQHRPRLHRPRMGSTMASLCSLPHETQLNADAARWWMVALRIAHVTCVLCCRWSRRCWCGPHRAPSRRSPVHGWKHVRAKRLINTLATDQFVSITAMLFSLPTGLAGNHSG
jgi:hypothetical protein